MIISRVAGGSILRSQSLKSFSPRCFAMIQADSATSHKPGETYWEKNKRLARPVSPHLTIYKPQLTSLLSISHRGTGLALSALISTFGIGMLYLPHTYPYYLGQLALLSIGPAVIYTAKSIIAFPFWFHTLNGIRHLTWDMGYGFSLRRLYQSGWGVVALAVLATAITVSL